MSSISNIYSKLPLIEDRLSTRILTLLPGEADEEIKCRLRVGAVSATSHYDAMSYTWGDATITHPITVNSRAFMVTTNLAQALLALRYPNKPRDIWVDAICINQANNAERAAQVQVMGHIYRCADRVIIWLGMGSEHAADMLRHMHECDRHFCQDETPCLDQYKHRLSLRGIQDIFSYKWWTRVWVVQELALASGTPAIGCGNVWIPWSSLVSWVKRNSNCYQLSQNQASVEKVLELDSMRRSVQLPPRLRNFAAVDFGARFLQDDLFDWLRRTTLFEATEPNDKIFALKGLSRSRAWARINIDYLTPIDEIVLQLISHWVDAEQDLNFMALCLPDRPSDGASWFPDLTQKGSPWVDQSRHTWNTEYIIAEFSEASIYPNPRWRQLMAEIFDIEKSELTEKIIPEDSSSCVLHGNALTARGSSIGMVLSVLDHELQKQSNNVKGQSGTSSHSNNSNSDIPSLSFNIQAKQDLRASYFYGAKELHARRLYAHLILDDGDIRLRAGQTPGANTWIDDETWTLASNFAQLQKKLWVTESILYRWKKVWQPLLSKPSDKNYPDNFKGLHDPICSCTICTLLQNCAPFKYQDRLEDVFSALRGRCQFTTHNGFIGIGPHDMTPGDEIVAFFASIFAYAIRPNSEISYQLVGPVIIGRPVVATQGSEGVEDENVPKIHLEPRDYVLR